MANVFANWRAKQTRRPSFQKQMTSRFEPKWTDEKLNNWAKVGSVALMMRDIVYPSNKNRFLFDGNCKLATNALNFTVNLFERCIDLQVRNTRFLQGGHLESYLNETSLNRMSMKNLVLNTDLTDQSAWYRYKMVPKAVKKQQKRQRIHPQSYKRAVSYNTGPAGFDLYDWAVSVLETWANYFFQEDLDTWVDIARKWIANPNTSEEDFINGDVGLRYWLYFMIRCDIPDNTSCSGGIGLGPAVLWVSLGILGLAILGAFVLPVIAQVLSILPLFILWFILVCTIGLHYSPRCALLGITISPLTFVLPECLADEIIAILDKYITNCYSPLILPGCMIAGELCPTNSSQYIDWVNCKRVGVADGIQNILFFGSTVIGQAFSNVMLYISSCTIGHWLPGFQEYMQTTLDGFKFAGPSQMCRQWWCFGLMFPAIALPFMFMIIFLLIAGFILPLLFSLILQLYFLFLSSPSAVVLPGNDEQTIGPYEEPNEVEIEQKKENLDNDIENARNFLSSFNRK
jgi:hypothetical protein